MKKEKKGGSVLSKLSNLAKNQSKNIIDSTKKKITDQISKGLPDPLSNLSKRFPDSTDILSKLNPPKTTIEPNPNATQLVYSNAELNEIKEMIYTVMEKKIPPTLLASKIENFIDKLSMDKDNVNQVKLSMMNLIFSDLNIIVNDKRLKYRIMLKLMTYPDISQIVDGLDLKDRNVFDHFKDYFIDPEKMIKGGDLQNQEMTPKEKAEDLIFKKICRLFDSDISDSEMLDLFLKYISNFFKNESPEKQRIFRKVMQKIEVFIDQLFQSEEFKDPEFRKYLFYTLLDGETMEIIRSALFNTSSANNTQIIEGMLKEELMKIEAIKGGSKKTLKKTLKKKKKRRTTHKIKN